MIGLTKSIKLGNIFTPTLNCSVAILGVDQELAFGCSRLYRQREVLIFIIRVMDDCKLQTRMRHLNWSSVIALSRVILSVRLEQFSSPYFVNFRQVKVIQVKKRRSFTENSI